MRRFALAAFGLAILVPYAAQGLWAEPSCDPSADPTTCNISAPLNVSSIAQTKAGALTLTGALTANGSFTANSSFSYTGSAANLNFTPSSIEDTDVSDTLTASIFRGPGSTTDAVDLNTAEVAGEQWVNVSGDTMTGALVMSTGSISNPAISITQPSSQPAITISGVSGSPAISLVPTGLSADGIDITMGTGTNGNNLDLYATGAAAGNIISAESTSTNTAAYPIDVTASGALRSINVSNTALGGYGIYAQSSHPTNGIGVSGSGVTYGVAGSSTRGYALYGRLTGTTGYAGYFDSSTTAGVGVYVTLSSGATTTASKALYAEGKNGYGGYFTTTGTSSTALYAGNTGVGGTGIVVNTAGVGLNITTNTSGASATGIIISTTGGHKGIEIDASSIGIDVSTSDGVAIEANNDDVHTTGGYRGGQFYPNENAGNGIYPNVDPNYIIAEALGSTGDPTNSMVFDGNDIWLGRTAGSSSYSSLELHAATDAREMSSEIMTWSDSGELVLADNKIYYFSDSASYTTVDLADGSIGGSSLASSIAINSAVYDGSSMWFGTSNRIYEWTDLTTLSSRVTSTGSISDMVYADGYIWAADSTNDVVRKVMTTSPYTSTSITVGDNPQSLVYDGQHVWVGNYTGNTLTRINTDDNSTRTYSVSSYGTGVQDLAFDGANIWIAYNNSGIGIFNIATESLTKENDMAGAVIGHLLFDGTYIWAVSTDSDYIFKMPSGTGFGHNGGGIRSGILMYNTSGDVRCLYITGTSTVTASSSLTNCQ